MTSLEITSVKITSPEKPPVRDYLSREIAIQDRLPVKTVHKYICAEDGNKEDIYISNVLSVSLLSQYFKVNCTQEFSFIPIEYVKVAHEITLMHLLFQRIF